MVEVDKPLFTPGPLTTSHAVKEAMLRDFGSRDTEFIDIVAGIRRDLLELAGLSQELGWEAILMQGSGTFAIESVISSITPPDGKWLVVVNGAYGDRIMKILQRYGIDADEIRSDENELPDLDAISNALSGGSFSHLAAVHCETTSGIINPVNEIGSLAKEHGCIYFLDSMSAFGGIEFNVEKSGIDFLVSSANKCIEGVPGFGFVICCRDALEDTRGYARTISLDILSQWEGLEKSGQFRFTPPTHVLIAFAKALDELREEGGIVARSKRYKVNHTACLKGMRALGFKEYVPESLQGHIITSFLYPKDSFDFEKFYDLLNDKGFVIYPGKITKADCFRIGHIGHIFEKDTKSLVNAISEVMEELN